MTSEEAQAYVDAMNGARGSVPAYHSVMARHDFEVLTAMNNLATSTLEAPRLLDSRTKQLLWVLALTVMRAGPQFLTVHIRRALDLGISDQEVLQAIELALPLAGVVAFLAGFEAWREATSAEGIEPSVDVD
jgi:4-carboxymuconolactone decarboxylase